MDIGGIKGQTYKVEEENGRLATELEITLDQLESLRPQLQKAICQLDEEKSISYQGTLVETRQEE